MKPYKRHSLLSNRTIRRMCYGRGHGVHSPRAYALVNSVVRPRGQYYYSFLGEVRSLLFRMVARLSPDVCVLEGKADKMTLDAIRLGCSTTKVKQYSAFDPKSADTALLMTPDCDKALAFVSQDPSKERYVLLTHIRSNRVKSEAFAKLTTTLLCGTIIDLYNCAILYNSDSEKYFYRSSL